MNMANFDSTKNPLQDMLRGVSRGEIQLPDFQRDWIWDDEHISSLIASVSQAFPIGAVMTLQNGGSDVRFKPRAIEGTSTSANDIDPETLILDGQQRITSLFQSLVSEQPVKTWDSSSKAVRRWYYLDINKCLDEETDREEAVLSIPEDRQMRNFRGEVTLDLSSAENEFSNDMFPVHRVFNSADWRRGYNEFWGYDGEKTKLFDEFESQVIKRFERYDIPVIRLDRQTPKEAVCLVFEKVNTGGVPLNVFELLTASFAADDFQLRDDWRHREAKLKGSHPVLRGERHNNGLQSDHFLQVLSLLATKAKSTGVVSCRRRDILRLTVEEYRTWAGRVEEGFSLAARFLHSQKIFSVKDLPYQTQIVPLAAILADLGDVANTEGARQKIAQWYWCGVFGELYGSAVETRFARDLPEATAWVKGTQEEPGTVRDANFQANRLVTLRRRNSAAYKGVHALLMRDGSRDFRSGDPVEEQTFFDDLIDIHHVFPQRWCKTQGIDAKVMDSIINKTALSQRTNRMIGGRAPSDYLNRLERHSNITADQMDEILKSHRIPTTVIRANNFQDFFSQRGEALLQAIQAVMGKEVPQDPGAFSLQAPTEEYDDGPIDWDEQGDPVDGET